jgi:hypothetical protein
MRYPETPGQADSGMLSARVHDLMAGVQLPPQPTAPPSALTELQPRAPPAGDDPLSVVGLALLAYGLVQLLARVVDKLPVWRSGPADRRAVEPGSGFTEQDRKRLERACEQLEVQQRLVGQALDGIRELDKRLENVLRKLRALWRRVGRRRGDRG